MISKKVKLLTLLCSLVLICQQTIAEEATKRIYKTLQFEVPIDHFSFASNKTFKIRYLYNDTFWDKENGPIFFYTGNEVIFTLCNVYILIYSIFFVCCIDFDFLKTYLCCQIQILMIEFKHQTRKFWIAP